MQGTVKIFKELLSKGHPSDLNLATKILRVIPTSIKKTK